MSRLAVLGLLMCVCAPAMAGNKKSSKKDTRIPSATYLDLTGAEVTATVVGPNMGLLNERPRAQFNPLIVLRSDFRVEMKQSVDEVR